MKKRWMLWVLISLMSMTAVLSGCNRKEEEKSNVNVDVNVNKNNVHEAVPNVVRIYDVESQDRSRMSKGAYEQYFDLQETYESTNDPYIKESLGKQLAAYNEVRFLQHEYRLGIFTYVGKYGTQIPFAEMISQVEKETGIGIELVVMDSWEEVRADIEKNRDDGITKIVLFNNSYDESLLKEVVSGTYVNMETAMEEVGLYDEELYQQAVIDAGKVNGGQYLIPLLYDVSGMIRGQEGMVQSAKDYEKISLSYEEFIGRLNETMADWEEDVTNVPFLSAGFYENQPDIFLMAAGQEWEDYEEQQELFTLLLHYVELYRDTVSVRNGMTNQELYMMYLEMNERNSYDDVLTEGISEDLELGELEEIYGGSNISAVNNAYMQRTQYFVESTGAEDIPFHSVLGLLAYNNYYCFSLDTKMEYGKMDYFPVGIWGEEGVFAAQPISYAALVEGGSEEMAAEVIRGLLNCNVVGQFGLSPCKNVSQWQIDNWLENGLGSGVMGRMLYTRSMKGAELDTSKNAGWGPGGFGGGKICQSVVAEQLREQIDNIVTAQIPDREILSIWQDTLTEAVDSGLSAEAGFELLCERMDEWYKG